MSCLRRKSKKDKLIEELESYLMMLEGQHQRLKEDVKREKQQWSKLEKTHQEESHQQQQQVIQLQTERSALETALLQASERSTSAQRQLDDTVQEKTDLQEALSDTTGKLQKAQEEIQALKEENAEDTIRYMSIVAKHQDEKQAMIDRNQEAMELLNAQIQDANSYIDKLKTQMEEQKTKLGTEASQLKATLATTKKELEENRANVLMKNSVIAAMEAENTKVKAENRELKTNILNQESQQRNVHAASEKRLLTAQKKYMDDVQALTVVCEEALKKAKRTSEHTIQELKQQLEQKDKAIHNLTENNEKEKQQLAKTQKELEEFSANLLMKNSVIAGMEENIAKLKAEIEEAYDEADDTVEEWEEERIEMERVQQSHLEEIQRLRESLESSEKERKELESVAREMLETKYGELTALSEGKKKQEVGIKKQVENQSRPISDLDESAKKHIQDLRDLFSYQIQEAKTDAAVKIRQLEAQILEQQLKNGHASEQDRNMSRCY